LISALVVLSLGHPLSEAPLVKACFFSHPKHFQKGIVDPCTMRKPKGTARTQVIEEEELLLLYTAMRHGY
jgi:hypothetical protein